MDFLYKDHDIWSPRSFLLLFLNVFFVLPDLPLFSCQFIVTPKTMPEMTPSVTTASMIQRTIKCPLQQEGSGVPVTPYRSSGEQICCLPLLLCCRRMCRPAGDEPVYNPCGSGSWIAVCNFFASKFVIMAAGGCICGGSGGGRDLRSTTEFPCPASMRRSA